jgi:hypothetical protein
MSSNPSLALGLLSGKKQANKPSQLNPYSHKPVSYKLVSREVPPLLPKEGSLVWKRAGFARHAVHVTKCKSSPPSPPQSLPLPHHHPKTSLHHPSPIPLTLSPPRRRRPTPPRRPPRPANLRRALARPTRLDRRDSQREPRQRRRRAMAHLRPDTLPFAGRLPRHAC